MLSCLTSGSMLKSSPPSFRPTQGRMRPSRSSLFQPIPCSRGADDFHRPGRSYTSGKLHLSGWSGWSGRSGARSVRTARICQKSKSVRNSSETQICQKFIRILKHGQNFQTISYLFIFSEISKYRNSQFFKVSVMFKTNLIT